MSIEKYNQEHMNNFILEQEELEIIEEDISAQRHILSNGSTFKCHINEINLIKDDIIDSSFNEEDDDEI